MKDWEYWLVGGFLLIITSIGRVLKKLVKQEISGKLAITATFISSLIGGIITGMIAFAYIESVQIQWVLISTGSWLGERVLEVVGTSLENKVDIIFKSGKNEK